ncbi:Nitrogenase cofactor biosynthesis protein NifB (plasmid) [Neorhizobium galegae bv. officinalis bv. officinalis str. HAMBI 1141]|uniref:FeMo cofactor biosynthesis protein NifB n=3 Tax=Neorhizobium galegae TaxID=399 RepID=A0A0T7G812_NEOGA|nr:nitrogenase cofactor biosynthesis protein NifB [Neorhizobium galegae]CDN58427.1 Nitrogenase cofactor biosynthesis protein NifB [Neorhizobium galegae bv. officinalis bv. officinalis str. HAMBI 1141]MCQ1797427.1 nitrogenase cofactor biosynthesis protein NifB [Neorhizobium galegae]MCQ1849244.1 nitrogenase cofactor biosynthesis protein NifB [Neorhizobium galegae]CDZ31103.1 Nitrogenase cofactor biosynthesis protein NifB [Neorhizobium galegae bv. officinalis]CDZ41108.1 Nitrogenase cofactor biosyn
MTPAKMNEGPNKTVYTPACVNLYAGASGQSHTYGRSAPDGADPAVWKRVDDHPCFSEDAHSYFARMHVAVAPACNIQCNYCNRKYDCANESRPGVTSERLNPDQALRKVMTVASALPQLSVLGIAGPGDACYDWNRTKTTLELVAKEIPDIKFCVSTNGLALPDHVEELAELNVDHVTITINMVDPNVGAKIYPWIFFKDRRLTGIEAASTLHERQMLGLEMLTERGILTKINSILIPGVNDEHLIEVNRSVRDRGAFIHNVTPLISDHSHGTYYGLTGQRGPTALELSLLQDRIKGRGTLMRHCRQCRADAVGLLGVDLAREFTTGELPLAPAYDPAKRLAYREFVERARCERLASRKEALKVVRSVVSDRSLLVAVTTKGGGRINEHFGHGSEFQIYEVSPSGISRAGHRKVEQFCLGGWCDNAAFNSTVVALNGVDLLLCAKIGDTPKKRLADAGVRATEAYAYDYIEAAIGAFYAAEFENKTAVAKSHLANMTRSLKWPSRS